VPPVSAGLSENADPVSVGALSGARLDPDLRPYVPLLPPLDLTDLVRRRAVQQRSLGKLVRPPVPAGVAVEDVVVPGPDGHEVPARLYRPTGPLTAPGLPGVAWLHGGAYCLGHLDLEDPACLRIVTDVGAAVLSVDYRLAPEHPFPAAIEDSYAALSWLAGAGGAAVGVDPGRLAVAGSSAGAGLAAALVLLARDRRGPRGIFQFLVSPTLDDRCSTASVLAAGDAPVLPRAAVEEMWRLYLGDGALPGSARVSPYAAAARADELRGLPPTYLAVGEVDPLRDEGVGYAVRLLAADVPVELHVVPGAPHGYDAVPDVPLVRRMQAEYTAAMRRGLGVGVAPRDS
jgi:acetyl esterase